MLAIVVLPIKNTVLPIKTPTHTWLKKNIKLDNNFCKFIKGYVTMAKILVIDDEELMRELVKKMLTRDGYEVFLANDGVEGIEIFFKLSPDLVITDIMMPRKDGFEVISEIYCHNPNFPVIAMSGGRRDYTENVNIDLIENMGLKGFLKKPFKQQDLLGIVKKTIDNNND